MPARSSAATCRLSLVLPIPPGPVELWDALLKQKDRESAKELIAYKEVPGSVYNVAQASVEWNSLIQQRILSRLETRGVRSAVRSCATTGGSDVTTGSAS
jgi:hypothetical protein